MGRVEDTCFIATEYVEGRTLRAEQRTRGRLPPADAMRIAKQCAAALDAAHQAGIIHRDIKPENVMLRTDGYVKVLDFGLATMREPAGSDAATRLDTGTRAGTVLGTTGYLSPEQARGLRVDTRSDVFALGVVLYEMLAGRAPFAGATPTDIVASILRSDPPALATLAPDVPAALDALVSRMLAKAPDERPESMASVAGELERLSTQQAVQSASRPKADRRRARTWVALASTATLALAGGLAPSGSTRHSARPMGSGAS